MKKIKLLLTVAIGFLLLNCTDMKEGFLMTENARFYPDSLIITAYTDIPEEPMDSDFPYQSNQISGVDGTAPVRYTVVAVHSDNGFDKGLEYVSATRDGRIEIMRKHKMPAGNYSVDLRIYSGVFQNHSKRRNYRITGCLIMTREGISLPSLVVQF